eukprot:1307277-Amphidinium_carterae.1
MATVLFNISCLLTFKTQHNKSESRYDFYGMPQHPCNCLPHKQLLEGSAKVMVSLVPASFL